MKKIIITGVNGFVGNHLAREFSDAGYNIVGVGGRLLGQKQPDCIDEYIEVDLTDENEVAKISFEGVDGVMHLAGLAAVGPSFDDPVGYVKKNVAMETYLFEAALRQGVKPKFVIVSSGALYDPKASLPLTESSSVVPSSPYAVSKITQEQMGQYYAMRGFEVVIARPFNHIGPGQGLGFLVPDLTKQIIDIEHGEATKLLVGNLEAKRDFTDVRDIAHAYRLLFENGRRGEIYNVCSGESHSGATILEKLMSLSTAQVAVEQDPTRMRPSDVPNIYGSPDKLTKDTGWTPQIAIEQTLQDVIEDWRSR